MSQAQQVAVGDTIVAADFRHSGVPVVVTAIKRVWLTAVGKSGHEYRFRLDDHTDGDRNFPAKFYTLAEWEEKTLHHRAHTFLRDQGIYLNGGSPWLGRQVELAKLLGFSTEGGRDA